MNRHEHLEWSKKRALMCVNHGDGVGALASMITDLNEHPDLKQSAEIAVMLMLAVDTRDPASVRRFIEGFN